MKDTIKLGISTCLLGVCVRYDGSHKLDRFLRDTLGQYVEYVPVCPEVECGMPTPRDELHLTENPENPRLVTVYTGKDYTQKIQTWALRRLKELEKEVLSGFIFKSKSPSCGPEHIKISTGKGMVSKKGVGIWARMFTEYFPLVPVVVDDRLHNTRIRENFIERVFVFQRWRELLSNGKTLSNLVDFHKRHKMLIMSHNVQLYRELGKLVAEGKKYTTEELFTNYLGGLAKALRLKTTVKKNINVLYQSMRYLKIHLSDEEKQGLLRSIDDYAHSHIPLIVPITLINHFARKYNQSYLKAQYYLNPHPLELRLKNHV